MDDIFNQFGEWLKTMIIPTIMSNLSSTFDAVNTQVGAGIILTLLLLAGVGGFAGYKYLMEKKTKTSAAKPDPDADYSEEDEEDYLDALGSDDESQNNAHEDLPDNTDEK